MNIIIKFIKQHIPVLNNLLSMYANYKILDYSTFSQQELTDRLMNKYQSIVGYRMDICNPKTFTEKLQWYKLFYEGDGNLIELVDKYLFKQYINEKLGDGYTIPLYGMWTSLKELERDWESLPEEFVLKSNLQSDGKYIKFIHKKSDIEFKGIKTDLRNWLNPKLLLKNGFCKAYHEGIPRIIAEQYLENVKDQLFDYKFFCFEGRPFCVYVAQDHFGDQGSYISFYDLDWNKLDVQYGNHLVGAAVKPKHFNEMVDISIKLSKNIPFVRVDFFDTDEQLYVAELTLYPGGGYTKYIPESFNIKMGELFNLPIINKEQWQEE